MDLALLEFVFFVLDEGRYVNGGVEAEIEASEASNELELDELNCFLRGDDSLNLHERYGADADGVEHDGEEQRELACRRPECRVVLLQEDRVNLLVEIEAGSFR
jgi:hypothetical protein